jgi:hypothetical protein
MKIRQHHIQKDITAEGLAMLAELQPDLLLAFGHVRFFEDKTLGRRLRETFPKTAIVGCSTAGEIVGDAVYDNTLVLTALKLEGEELFLATARVESVTGSRAAGEAVGRELATHNVTSAFVLAPGLDINGSDLVLGLSSALGDKVAVTGGLAGDNGKFQTTYTLCNEVVTTDTVVAFGLRGKSLTVSYGSQGGWLPFGPSRLVTRAESNILFELDGKPALQLYKEYLGEVKAKELPGSGLLYPFAVLDDSSGEIGLIRTILNIDEKAGSLILAGNIPQGGYVRLMHAQKGALVDGAQKAAEDATRHAVVGAPADFSILVSCVGRKLVMGDDVDDETITVKKMFNKNSVIAGFYSYGEICPFGQSVRTPQLHNQTMTITRFTQNS